MKKLLLSYDIIDGKHNEQDIWDGIRAGKQVYIRMNFTAQNVIVDETDIEASGGLTIVDSMDTGENTTIGKVCCKQLTANILLNNKTKNIRWKDRFELRIGIKFGNSNTITFISMGYYNGIEPTKARDATIIQLVAYDDMIRFDTDATSYIEAVKRKFKKDPVTTTVRDLVDLLCEHVGYSCVVARTNTLNWSGSFYDIPSAIEMFEKFGTLREVLEKVAEACCLNARIRNNSIYFSWYGDTQSGTIPTISLTDQFSLEYQEPYNATKWGDVENDKWSKYSETTWDYFTDDENNLIDGVCVIGTYVDELGELPYSYYTELDDFDLCSNPYTIKDNVFCETAPSFQSYNIYNNIRSIGNRLPFSLECTGNFNVEANDIVDVVIDENTTMTIPICFKTFSFTGSCKDIIELTGNK